MTHPGSIAAFALGFHVLLFGMVIAGFGTRAIVYPEYWPPVRATLIGHIVVTGGWFVLVLVQAWLVARRRMADHRRVGRAGIALALLVLVSGTAMIVELNLREFSMFQVVSNGVNMVTFAVFFGAALVWRRDWNAHMRMITFASLSIMTPAIARLLQPLGLEVLTHPVWLLLCLPIAIFDLRVDRRLSPATGFGLVVSGFGFAVFAVVASMSSARAETASDFGATLSGPEGYTGRVRLVRFLDEPDGYCLDVPGGGDRVLLQMPAIAHTCHFDPLADQVFSLSAQGLGQIVWNNAGQSVCLTADAAKDGAGFGFQSCDEVHAQRFVFETNGEIRLRGSDLCMSVERTGPGFGAPPIEDQDAFGRGRAVNPQYTHLARALVLAPCGAGDPSMQRWMAYPEGVVDR